MSTFGRFKQFCAALFARPGADRVLHQAIRHSAPAHLLLVGLGDGARCLGWVDQALTRVDRQRLRVTGIDLFETRPAGLPHLSLKEAHRLFKSKVDRVQLLPGDPLTALAQGANSLSGVDLLLISADQAGAALERAWFFIPRTLAAGARCFVERPGAEAELVFEELSRAAVEQLAAAARPRRKAA